MVFESIKKYKKNLAKKPKEIEVQTQQLPGFQIEYPKSFFELPTVKNLTEINVKYPLILPFANAHIVWNPQIEQVQYILEEPLLSEDEKKKLNVIANELIDMIQVGFNAIKDGKKVADYLESQIKKILENTDIQLDPEQFTKIMYFIYRDFIGLNQIEPLLRDPWIEDIGCDGVGIPLYIVHRKYGSLKTNVVFNDLNELREFVIKLAERCGRYVSYAEPILDGTLPDGSRVNASLAGDVTTRGPTFSIRKFAERPYSPIEIIEFGTCSPEIMAYFWYLVENGASIMIAGGVATGKTTFLNSICMFIPPEAKIVSIEDTRELRIPHEHWIPAVTRLGFGIPMPTGEKYGEITLFDLLKSSFRQNPDYVIVGEVRGKEAYVMFQGMSSGHPSLTTFHAGSIDTVIKRLTTPPIELSASLVESLDVVAIVIHAKERGKSARRIKEVEEIKSIDSETLRVITNRVSDWDPATDKFNFYGDSLVLKKIARNRGITFEDAIKEVGKRKAVLKWMLDNGIKDFEEVSKLINEYYKNPEKILERIGNADTEIKMMAPRAVEVDISMTGKSFPDVVEAKLEEPVMVEKAIVGEVITKGQEYAKPAEEKSKQEIHLEKPKEVTINVEKPEEVTFVEKLKEKVRERIGEKPKLPKFETEIEPYVEPEIIEPFEETEKVPAKETILEEEKLDLEKITKKIEPKRRSKLKKVFNYKIISEK